MIVWILQNYPPVVLAGAEFAAHRINKWLLSQGFAVTVYIQSNESYPSEFEGVQIKRMNPFDCYTMILEPGTILVSQLWATRSARTIFDRNPHCKYIEFIHYVDATVITPYPWTQREFTLVYNSKDTRQRSLAIGSWLSSKQSFVFPPLNDPPLITPPTRTNFSMYPWITLVNFNKDKGADIFNQLALIDQTRKYVGIKGSHGAQEKPVSQIELIDPTFDMEHIWKHTRILVVLSTYETWSLVASEAMLRGIPVVAANHIPALKENCENAAVYVNRTNLDECISAFDTIELNYEMYSEKSRAQADLPDFEELAKIFS
jgi:hypothetical protein